MTQILETRFDFTDGWPESALHTRTVEIRASGILMDGHVVSLRPDFEVRGGQRPVVTGARAGLYMLRLPSRGLELRELGSFPLRLPVREGEHVEVTVQSAQPFSGWLRTVIHPWIGTERGVPSFTLKLVPSQ